jgi:hypothetical protein
MEPPQARRSRPSRVLPWVSVAVALAAALLSGCLSRPAPRAEQPPPADCGADRLDWLRGQPFAQLAGVALPGELRVLRPNQPIGVEMQPSRLSLRVDKTGRVLRLFCG